MNNTIKLFTLLNIIESFTTVSLYVSDSKAWSRENEKHIIAGNTFHIMNEIDTKYLDYNVIGLKIDDDGFNSLHICIYKG